ncbi:Hypothetical protein HVR_LOCUS112 [uncultured virus]|nr:Hypothetical protein HVR_LOCUS112 [uncultured virus]
MAQIPIPTIRIPGENTVEATTTTATTTELDATRLNQLLEAVSNAHAVADRVTKITEVFTYVLQYPDFFVEHPELAYSLRNKARGVEVTTNELVASEMLDFESGMTLVQLANHVLAMTAFIADFDCTDADEPQHNHQVDLPAPPEEWSDEDEEVPELVENFDAALRRTFDD